MPNPLANDGQVPVALQALPDDALPRTKETEVITVEEVNELLVKYDWNPHFGVREFHAELSALLVERQGA